MLKLFKEIRKTGDATVGYPFTPLEMPAGFRGGALHRVRGLRHRLSRQCHHYGT